MELLRATAPDETAEAAGPDDADGESRGEGALETTTPRSRRRKPTPPAGKNKSRNLRLPDDVYDRLRLLAYQRRSNVSAVAVDLLDRALPKFKLERQA